MFECETYIDPAKPQSEDALGTSQRAAWVLDGADGRSDAQFSDPATYYSDGVWYTRQLDAYLHAHVDDTDHTLREHVANAIAHVSDQYAQLRDRAVDAHETPAATIALVRWTDDHLEYYNLADASIIVGLCDSQHGTDELHIRDVGPRVFDATLRDHLVDTYDPETDDTLFDRDAAADQFLRDQFARRNTHEGYYVAGLDPSVTYNGLQGRIPLDAIADVLLFSDGLEPLVETFNVYESWAAARTAIRDAGLDDVVDTLRHYETEVDPTGERFPRTKQSDDVSSIYLRRQ